MGIILVENIYKIKTSAQDYEPDWMKGEENGWAIGRRIYDKSEIEVTAGSQDPFHFCLFSRLSCGC
jgi:hypothetical protein